MIFKNKILNFLLLAILLNSNYTNSIAFSVNDHRIAVLVNDELITSYDIVQRMKMNAILTGIEITPENNNQFINSVVDELIKEKLKNEKLGEYDISVSEDEFAGQEKAFYNNKPFTKDVIIETFKLNNIEYSEFKKYLIDEISWQKLILEMYFRLTSTSEIEIEEIFIKNPNITKDRAREIIVQRQLDLKSNKMIRDMFNEATIEYK